MRAMLKRIWIPALLSFSLFGCGSEKESDLGLTRVPLPSSVATTSSSPAVEGPGSEPEPNPGSDLPSADNRAQTTVLIYMNGSNLEDAVLDPSGVDPAVVKREKDVLADKFRQQGKPEAMIEKITESGLKTFYKEQTLLEQPFIFDDKKSVAQALKEAEGKVGAPVKIAGFVRYALGEGIEKSESDFAAEVAAAAGQG